ncbi:MAG TPA: FKBP-type peptidyl-prolyl cis-trans isomerase [Nocardioides sp.]|uniref:FKBP-type peptidyl-prolyl cis-trans isomerase n=1 Tax=Nocardioides sp. TaxID=35761 RepID=UPI002D7E8E7B|nr:FKBP-type peptidyl-prolyl cis-trans isomerase [Nocardioides sp.]HET6651017.1 FKBP-type peptidyl-prolyl cis-trans isomerase [Nocardioides sp.]
MRRRLIALSAVSLLLFGTAACGDDGESPESSSSGAEIDGLSVEGAVGEELTVDMEAPLDGEGTKTEVLETGEGNPLKLNESALLHLYIGNATSGKDAISTYDQGVPIQVTASEDQLFKAVLDNIVDQPRGSRVAVTAPVKDVWGEQGAPQLNLKASDTALFVADIVSVQPAEVIEGPEGESVDPTSDAPTVEEKDGQVTGLDWSTAPKKAPKKLTVIPLVEGEGPEATAESMVTFDYYGAVYGEDKPFDESYSREPTPFGVGVKGLIPAWDKVIPGLKRGSRVLIIAPPEDAYGDQEQPNIPAGSTLTFVVDVLGVDE